ncbi:hypothetical protein ACE1ET_07350 [Saccharicrinis sp. FJH62]|uniref:hypothetical protein n=1 Tax=Saccharicrinis sp. FJH62 TaxID=3344657 RepID=UPI0035D4A2D2
MVNELLSDSEEDVKIKQIQKRTNKLAISLLKILIFLVVCFVLGSIPVVTYILLSKREINSLEFFTFYPMISITFGATVPFVIPYSKKNESGYSELSQLLHRIALDNYQISEKLFKRETQKIKRKQYKSRKDFVIISGLARAGTTSLMNDLSKINKLVTLSYANMPFLMSPNLWAKFYKPRTKHLKERSHKDGIMIGYNSNEALEEYFFKVKANDSFIHETYLSAYKISEKDYIDYLDYQTNIKHDNTKIYLAKNNNFILRYNSIREFNDDFIMVILYRDPVTHAASLLEKHQYYSALQKKDPFILDYMNWLGHHEFGLNHKPFIFSDTYFLNSTNKDSIDYWLKTWINYYNYVLTIRHPNTLLVNYSTYCKNPENVIKLIANKVGIQTIIPEYKPFKNIRSENSYASKELLEEAQSIYIRLQSHLNSGLKYTGLN